MQRNTQRDGLRFVKMHGAGNDFVVIDNRSYSFSARELQGFAPQLCHRHVGIGADGVLALEEAEQVDFRMIYINADGSRASMCGNGARCIARFARKLGFTSQPLRFQTDAGIYRADVPSSPEDDVRLFVPPPRSFRESDIAYAGRTYHYVWTGTPHVVCFVDDLAGVPVQTEGADVRRHRRYLPEGTNVNFVQVAGPAELRVRTFEKGVEEETAACGTGAIAAAVIARLTGEISEIPAAVEMKGGKLRVGFDMEERAAKECFLEGPAEVSFTGAMRLRRLVERSETRNQQKSPHSA